ncbi:protein mei2-like 7 [Phtheirospermum japonicum]|uniref:Protein mei2-like 7 n=1 Tax=Phtheirospermum japonicum TaxID=374723 RepID=A0A830BJK9_9LAMI|nr:protein mei2-like 7 [Phtheirospermum japonicum]
MLKFLDSYCKAYSLEYDFMYLPMDFRYLDNLGYAFVNFTSGDAAQKFKEVLQGYKWNTFQTDGGKLLSSKKICDITWARIQGKEGLVKRFQNSTFACDKPGFLPVMLDPPRNGSDPNPAPPLVVGRIWRRDISKTH